MWLQTRRVDQVSEHFILVWNMHVSINATKTIIIIIIVIGEAVFAVALHIKTTLPNGLTHTHTQFNTCHEKSFCCRIWTVDQRQ